jgi:hypothetical protein
VAALEDEIVIVPRLFRRLVDYLRLRDDSMAGFPAFLDQVADKFFILSGWCIEVGRQLLSCL